MRQLLNAHFIGIVDNSLRDNEQVDLYTLLSMLFLGHMPSNNVEPNTYTILIDPHLLIDQHRFE